MARSAVVLWLVLLCLPSLALAVDPPHVVTDDNDEACAMCHRTHSSASGDMFLGIDGELRSSLLVGDSPASVGDTELCYSCHGYGSLGSSADVQSEAEKRSAHIMAPGVSTYGPTPKDCSSCHDSHGQARTTSDTPYPALLRALEGTSAVYTGDAYCNTCHKNRAGDLWPDMGDWEQTAHADVTATASGTDITCSVCHAPHGSNNRALVTELLLPPSAPATVTVTGNDRSLCFGCHAASSATYPGSAVYEGSGHGSSATTVAISAEWVGRLAEGSTEASRTVGECQVCHAPMGRDDGTGDPITELLKAEGSDSCYQCHGEASSISTDIESEYTTAGAPVLEVVAGYAATPTETQFSVVQIYTRDETASATLLPPRQAVETSVGPTTAGDIDGDGDDEVLVSRAGTVGVTVLGNTDVSGLVSQSGNLMAAASYIAVADVIDNVSGPANEVIAADGTTVRFYRWDDPGFTYLAAVPTTATVSGLAVGDVAGTSGVGADEVVVTTAGVNAIDNRLLVLASDGLDMEVAGDYLLTGDGPRGPAVGNYDGAGKHDIAVAFSGENANVLRIYRGDGSLITQGGTTAGNQPAQHAFIGNILWGSAGIEAAVTFADAADGSRVAVFDQTGGGLLGTPVDHTFPAHSNAAAMDAGDVDGDGHSELVVSLAGSFPDKVLAGIQVLQTNAAGTAIASADVYAAGGTERADSVPGMAWVSVADLGDIGRSRHAVDEAVGSHVSTETAPFDRHVACADCHNVHASTDAVAQAPTAYGPILGTWGVGVENAPVGFYTYTDLYGIENEYELCFKCHSQLNQGERRDIAAEVDTRNASVHAIEASSTQSDVVEGTFVIGSNLTNESILYCGSCHGNSDTAGPRGLHASDAAPLLKSPYAGLSANDASSLCFDCHRYEVFYTGEIDSDPLTGSRFWKTSGNQSLHRLHGYKSATKSNAISCQACHKSHGSSLPHLIREDVGYTHNAAGGGECDNSCHKKMVYNGR